MEAYLVLLSQEPIPEAPFAELVDLFRLQAHLAIVATEQFDAARDNQIQDLLHEQLDAHRPSGGKTLEEFLASDAK